MKRANYAYIDRHDRHDRAGAPFGNDGENRMRADDIANQVRSDRDALRPDQPPGTETVFNGRQTLTAFDCLQLTVLTELLPEEDPTTAEEKSQSLRDGGLG